MTQPVPPLLMIAEGRRPRLRKAPIVRPKEVKLQCAVAKLLSNFARDNWMWSHFPAGEIRDKRTAGKLKQMGLQRGWPDVVLVSPAGLFHALELKRLGDDLSEDQEIFQKWCAARGVPHSVAWTIDDALAILDHWGCLAIKFAEVSKRRPGGANNPAGLGGKSGKIESDIVNVDNVHVDKELAPERPTGNPTGANQHTKAEEARAGTVDNINVSSESPPERPTGTSREGGCE